MKGETAKDRPNATGVDCKGSKTFAGRGRAATAASLAPGTSPRVYQERTITTRQYKPAAGARRISCRGIAVGNARDHPRGVCVIFYSPPPFGSISFAHGGKPAIVTKFIHGAAVYTSREGTVDTVELSSGRSASVSRKGTTVAEKGATTAAGFALRTAVRVSQEDNS